MLDAATVMPASLLVPRTNAHSLTAIADGVAVTVLRIAVFDERTTDFAPNRPVTVNVDPLTDEIVPNATPPDEGLNPAPPDPLAACFGAFVVPKPPAHWLAVTPVITSWVASSAEPLAVPDALMQSPAFRLASVPAACFVIAVFELSFTFELPVLVAWLVIVNVEPVTEVTAPTTEPETELAAETAPTPTPAVMHAVTNATALLRRSCCVTSILLLSVKTGDLLSPEE
jgi:hypothetical protein